MPTSNKLERYRCKFCGQWSWLAPIDQVAPIDYCHPEDHGIVDDILPPCPSFNSELGEHDFICTHISQDDEPSFYKCRNCGLEIEQ